MCVAPRKRKEGLKKEVKIEKAQNENKPKAQAQNNELFDEDFKAQLNA